MTISPYQRGITTLKTEAYTNNIELASKVLLHKQQSFDKAYAGINKLRREALDIHFINKESGKKIKAFNESINKEFGDLDGELGDLSNRNLVKSYTDKFNVIGQDLDLIANYKKDSSYQAELLNIQSKRDSANPKENGYNYQNAANYSRRLKKWENAKLSETSDISIKPYTNYVDYDDAIREATKDILVEEYSHDHDLGNGMIETRTFKGKDPNKVLEIVNAKLGSEAAAQVREEAEFNFYNNNNPEFKERIYRDSQAQINNSKRGLEAQHTKLKTYAKKLKGTELENVSGKIAQIEESIISLDKQLITFDKFSEKSEDDVINMYTSLYSKELSQGYSEALGGMRESRSLKTNQAYWNLLNFNEKVRNNNRNYDLNVQEFMFEQLKEGYGADGKPNTDKNLSQVNNSEIAQVDALAFVKNAQAVIGNQKDFLTVGAEAGDITPRWIQDSDKQELEKLQEEVSLGRFRQAPVRGGGTVMPLTEQEKERNREKFARIKYLKELQAAGGRKYTPEEFVKYIMDNPDKINNSIITGAGDVLAIKASIEFYKTKSQTYDEKDVLAKAKLIIKDKNSYAYQQKQKGMRFLNTANAMAKDIGLDDLDTLDGVKKAAKRYMKNNSNNPVYQIKTWEFNTGINDKKGDNINFATIVSPDLNNLLLNSSTMIAAETLITPGEITTEDILRYAKNTSGGATITFTEEAMKKFEGRKFLTKTGKKIDLNRLTYLDGSDIRTDVYNQMAQQITKEIKPFSASVGSKIREYKAVISNTQGRDQYLIVLDNDTEYRIDVVSRTGGKLTSETIHDKVQELYQNEENQNKNGGK
jgi:hypothetical protein